jgi:hypothetical protein
MVIASTGTDTNSQVSISVALTTSQVVVEVRAEAVPVASTKGMMIGVVLQLHAAAESDGSERD